MYLFFDTETTGFPNGKLQADHPEQCSPVQLAAILTTKEGREMGSMNVIIDPKRPISEGAIKIHGITQEIAETYGVTQLQALMAFEALVEKADIFVAHNSRFDVKVIGFLIAQVAGLDRGKAWADSAKAYCTMLGAKSHTRIPPTDKMMATGRREFKAPSLAEAYLHFFGKPLQGAHDAMVDCRGCMDVFFAIKEREEEATTAPPPTARVVVEEDDEAAAI